MSKQNQIQETHVKQLSEASSYTASQQSDGHGRHSMAGSSDGEGETEFTIKN